MTTYLAVYGVRLPDHVPPGQVESQFVGGAGAAAGVHYLHTARHGRYLVAESVDVPLGLEPPRGAYPAEQYEQWDRELRAAAEAVGAGTGAAGPVPGWLTLAT